MHGRKYRDAVPVTPSAGFGRSLRGWSRCPGFSHCPHDDDPRRSRGTPGLSEGRTSMFTVCPWTTHRSAAFGTAGESNAYYRRLVARGTTELSVVFDLPTQLGVDSDAPVASGEVGRAGVAVDSIDDMRVLFTGIPLDRVSTSMAVGAPAAVLLLLYQLVAEEQGLRADRLTGTVHHDVLTEYVVRGRYVFPPEPSLRLAADLFAYCRAQLPRWNTLSFSGRALAEAGATPAQEIAFTLAEGVEHLRTAVAYGMEADDFAPRLSFLFGARATLLEELATLRAARRVWSRVLGEQFGARGPASRLPVRWAVRGLAAVLGGRPHGSAPSVRPFAGSRAAAGTADALEAAALELMRRVEELGGAVAALGHGFQRDEIERAAHHHRCLDGDGLYEAARLDPVAEQRQTERLAKLRAWRCADRVDDALIAVRKAAEGSDNVLHPMKQALASGATVGEVCDTLRQVWGAGFQPAA
ncbi:methylmalonyl-CoA mutase family protein [Streptomyces sp. NBC_01176]|uniref:methylmalonyl-CoA mutase family protein n=1 Tax=Streptomyces sp. NBC_01176 TaxID=2903760 RepID=UPI00386EBB41|nr:acyl-CoA mutase large subunit family protein [Streptomyces sp. NBC_01176]WSS89949.1 acyl-CoA mutase large subunit family protein [Streptomyces sp. NBC_01176]